MPMSSDTSFVGRYSCRLKVIYCFLLSAKHPFTERLICCLQYLNKHMLHKWSLNNVCKLNHPNTWTKPDNFLICFCSLAPLFASQWQFHCYEHSAQWKSLCQHPRRSRFKDQTFCYVPIGRSTITKPHWLPSIVGVPNCPRIRPLSF